MEGSIASLFTTTPAANPEIVKGVKSKNKSKEKDAVVNKRRCVSTACIACRRRKSKCDGNLPKCAACASVYLTDCEYAPHTDHRRKGVYKKDVDHLKTKNSTLHVLIQALLNAEEEEDAFELVRQIRSCDNLEDLALTVENRERGIVDTPDSPVYGDESTEIPQFEAELSSRIGDMVIDGSVKFIGGTSNLIWLNDPNEVIRNQSPAVDGRRIAVRPREEAILSWTTVTQDKDLILHFMNMYFCWHYAYFTTLSKELFYRDFLTGTNSQYCSSLLVNVMLALGCHFSSKAAARANPKDSSTTGNHFFAEAKRLLHDDDEEFGVPKLCTVQALALMSVREAGCGRESKGWFYSGMSFRLAADMGLNIDAESMRDTRRFSDEEIDARRITFWGCFLFDKCWSNYLGRQPQFVHATNKVTKPDVFGSEDSELWSPYIDSGIIHTHTQPARTRAVSLQIFKLAEISSDLLHSFYQPQHSDKPSSKQAELKKLSDIHTRLEAWKKDLPLEMEAKDGQLPQVILMHMVYQLLYIHLYRPFLKYTKATSPLPTHVSPRKFCTQAASAISKLFRLYKRTHGLRQICNIAVYIAHSACTIHLLNLPDKNAKRDIIHGVKQLEEIGDCWICARRTLRILGLCVEKWKIELPEEAQATLHRTNQRWGEWESSPAPLPPMNLPMLQHIQSHSVSELLTHKLQQHQQQQQHTPHHQGRDIDFRDPPPLGGLGSIPMQSIATAIDEQQQQQQEEAPPPPENHATIPMMPQSETSQSHNRPKFSLNLTQAQQDAWNALQAKMGHLTPGGAKTPNEQPPNAAAMFGGVESLIEESQDWWYNDQSQLALGFDNWNTSSSSDWTHMANSGNLGLGTDANAGGHIPNSQGTRPFLSAIQTHSGVNPMMSPTSPGIAVGSFPMTPSQQQHHHLHALQHAQRQQAHGSSGSPPTYNVPHMSSNGTTAQKRMSFHDDMIY